MKIYELIILTLHHSEQRMIAGRTLFQKTIYFINEKMHLGINFVPYYYGPYSAEISETISSLKANGIIEERVNEIQAFNFDATFEPRLYIYNLTNIGKQFVLSIDKKQKTQSKKVKNILTEMKSLGAADDYKTLSIAAKMYHILRLEEKPMTTEEILKESKFLKWKISKNEAKAAIKFLDEMKFVMLAVNKH